MQGIDWHYWLRVALILYWSWFFGRMIYRRIKRSKPVLHATSSSTVSLAFDARERLIAALLGDYKAADRLIAYEQSIAGPIGCGKLEAVERALQRLERDRSRTN